MISKLYDELLDVINEAKLGRLGFISPNGQIEFANEEHRDIASEGLVKFLSRKEIEEILEEWGTWAWVDRYTDLSSSVRYDFQPGNNEVDVSVVKPVTSSQMRKIKAMADLLDPNSFYFDIKELEGNEQRNDMYRVITSGSSFSEFVKALRKHKLIKESEE